MMTPNPVPTPKRKPRGSGTTGTKVLVTAASLAAIIAGWAGLTLEQKLADTQAAADPAAENPTGEPGSQADTLDLSVSDLPPLPTLVPQQAGLPYVSAPLGSGFTPAGQSLVVVNLPSNSPLPTPGITTPNGANSNNKQGSKEPRTKSSTTKSSKSKSGGGGGTAKTRAS